MSTTRTTPSSGVSSLVLAGVLWGTGGLLGSLFGEAAGLSSPAVAAYRLAVGGLVLLCCLFATGGRLPRTRAAWARIVATGVLAAWFQAAYFTAVSLTSVSVATLVTIGSSPVLVLLARPRRATRRAVAAVALAVLGLVLLVGVPADGGPSAGAALAGAVFAVLAAAGFTLMSVLGARPVPGLDPVTTTGAGFTVGGALLLPVAATVSGVGFAPTPASVGLLLAFGVVPTALAYTFYFRGLRTAPVGVGVLMALLEPLTAAVLAAVLLGDRLGVSGIAGGLLLAVALVLTARGQVRARRA